jgi:tRNA splicing endonuclease
MSPSQKTFRDQYLSRTLLLEANYLLEKGLITVKTGKRVLSREQLLRLSKKQYRLFEELYAVYKDLRDKGYVVRPALKFGADLRYTSMALGLTMRHS